MVHGTDRGRIRMTLQVRYCPQCGTRRTGYFRFCGRCGLDFDELAVVKPGEAEAPAAPPKPEPTTPIWPPPPAQWPPAGALPSAAVKALSDAPPDPVTKAAAEASATTARNAAPSAAPIGTDADQPAISWPGPDAVAPRPQRPAERPLLARAVDEPQAAGIVATEPVPRGNVIPSRPGVTWTRIAIVMLAALLAFSAVSRAVTPSYYANPTPLPTTVLESPLVVGPTATPLPVTSEPSTTAASSGAEGAPGASFGPSGQTQVAVVTRIVDGDTIHVDIDGTDYPVRYIGMDTPEPTATDPTVKRLADAATAQNAALVDGQEVYLEKDVSETDRYGRLLRDIWLVDSGGSMVLINLELVRMGYAQVTTFPPDVKYVDLLTAAEQKAKADHAGLWGSAPSN